MMVMLEAFKVKKIPRLFWSSEKTFTLVPEALTTFYAANWFILIRFW